MIRCPTDAARVSRVTAIRFFTRLLVAIYFLEAGLLLAWAPWTRLWDRNLFLDRLPWLRPVMDTLPMRGVFVTAGALTVIAGMVELRAVVFGRSAERASGQSPEA